MRTELFVLRKLETLETFDLAPGTHLLGSGPDADLILAPPDAPPVACLLDLSEDGQLRVQAMDEEPLRDAGGNETRDLRLENGSAVDCGDLRLVVIQRGVQRGDAALDVPAALPTTAVSSAIRPPPKETLALMVTTIGKPFVVRLDAPTLSIGRGEGNGLRFTHPEVSERHARLFRRPDGPHLEDLGSKNGTFLDGHRLTSGAWPVGGTVALSAALDAPRLRLVPLSEALSETDLADEALLPIRGASEAMQRLRAQIQRYADLDDNVILQGETGCGKELVARALGALHVRCRDFYAMNCGGLTPNLVAADLFGAAKGAYTGATQDRPGAMEAAGAGTLFLDEIGELPLELQAQFLRVFESKEFRRLGETKLRPFRARVVAATHRNLPAMVAAGQFRADLYERLNQLTISIPPLRHRPEDIPVLARHFLAERTGKTAGKILGPGTLEKLQAYTWPRNVRELRNALLRAAVDTDTTEIPPEAIALAKQEGDLPAPPVVGSLGSMPMHLSAFERDLLVYFMVKANNVLAYAAEAAGVEKTVFRRALERHGMLPGPRKNRS